VKAAGDKAVKKPEAAKVADPVKPKNEIGGKEAAKPATVATPAVAQDKKADPAKPT